MLLHSAFSFSGKGVHITDFLLLCHQFRTNEKITKAKNEAKNVTITIKTFFGLIGTLEKVGSETNRELLKKMRS